MLATLHCASKRQSACRGVLECPMFKPLLIALLCASLVPMAQAAKPPPQWRIEPVHSRVVFDVEHAGFSRSLATLSAPEGQLVFDPKDWSTASVEVRLPMARLDFGDADWNKTMLSKRWFHAEDFPELVFRSTRVEAIDAQNARVFGLLQVRDVAHEVMLQVRLNDARRNPLTLRRTVGFSATGTLNRTDFGLDDFPQMIGNAVTFRIEVEATRQRARSADGAAGSEDSSASEPETSAADEPTPPEPEHADSQQH